MADAGFSIPWPIVWSGGAGGGAGVQAISETVIATTNYSLHPINCMMAGNDVVDWERVTVWKMPDGVVPPKALPRARTGGVVKISTGGFRLPAKWTK